MLFSFLKTQTKRIEKVMLKHPLSKKINSHFTVSTARLYCIEQIILGLIKISSVNLTLLATTFSGKVAFKSKYRQLQRFFADFSFSINQFAQFIVHFFGLEKESWLLALDRTNWAYGKTQINILTLAIVFKGTAIPLFWLFLDKKGNSNTQERLQLIDRFLALFTANKIQSLLCDREFIGIDWLNGLIKRSIPFCIRIKANMRVYCPKGKLINKGIRRLGRGCSIIFDGVYSVGDKDGIQAEGIKIAAFRRHDNGELVIIVTNGDPRQALDNYLKRWGIEVLFANLKTRGFNLEDTHLTKLDRISTMLQMVSIAYIWALKTGEQCSNQEPIRLKAHGRKEISIFRKGLNYLRTILYNIQDLRDDLLRVIDLFPGPNIDSESILSPSIPID
jgi:Transposase DDE domain